MGDGLVECRGGLVRSCLVAWSGGLVEWSVALAGWNGEGAWTHRQTDRQADRQTGGQTDRRADELVLIC